MTTKHERTHIDGNYFFSHGVSLNGTHADVVVEIDPVKNYVISIRKAKSNEIEDNENITPFI